ncbi:MAG: Hsp20/alpha crystallin family protein [Gaiellales bacterium]|nr:MAG: Hsp20/alpha crystallin family protein [Gaiellales bacterium]
MMALVRWTPFKEMLDMPREMRRLVGRPFRLFEEPFSLDTFGPAHDIFARGTDMVVRMELPGVDVEDIEISLVDHTLVMMGERRVDKEVKEDDYYRRERSFGSFERSIPVPEKVTESDISAAYKDGILEVTVAGAVETEPAKRIEIKTAEGEERKIEPTSGEE